MKKNITQNAIKNFLIFISVWIMILSGVYIVNSAVLPLYNRAVTVNITATGEQNPKALRLSDIKVNGQELNLGKLEYTAESTWKYDSANDFLYAYDLDGASELLVNLPGVHSLELTFVEEVGSGCVNIYVNGKLLESRDLYADTDWKEVPVKCTTSIWVFPEEHGAVWLITFGIALLLTVGIIKLNKNQKNTEIISVRIILHAFLALFLELLAVFVQYGTVNFRTAPSVHKNGHSYFSCHATSYLYHQKSLDLFWNYSGSCHISGNGQQHKILQPGNAITAMGCLHGKRGTQCCREL